MSNTVRMSRRYPLRRKRLNSNYGILLMAVLLVLVGTIVGTLAAAGVIFKKKKKSTLPTTQPPPPPTTQPPPPPTTQPPPPPTTQPPPIPVCSTTEDLIFDSDTSGLEFINIPFLWQNGLSHFSFDIRVRRNQDINQVSPPPFPRVFSVRYAIEGIENFINLVVDNDRVTFTYNNSPVYRIESNTLLIRGRDYQFLGVITPTGMNLTVINIYSAAIEEQIEYQEIVQNIPFKVSNTSPPLISFIRPSSLRESYFTSYTNMTFCGIVL